MRGNGYCYEAWEGTASAAVGVATLHRVGMVLGEPLGCSVSTYGNGKEVQWQETD
jgi:hypothetical protein